MKTTFIRVSVGGRSEKIAFPVRESGVCLNRAVIASEVYAGGVLNYSCLLFGVARRSHDRAAAYLIPGSSVDICHSYRVLPDEVGGNQSERWAGAGKVRLATAEHERAEV